MVAAPGFDELHNAVAVTSCVVLSLNVPVAVNCLVVPGAVLAGFGVTASETKVAAVTVSCALPLTEPEVAVMLLVPVPTAAAMPLTGSTVATPVSEDDQVTELSNCVLPSSKVPTAVNACVVPIAMLCGFGVTEIEIRFAGTTVMVVVSLKEPTVAVIVVCPAPAVEANPELSIVATEVADEVQVTPAARSCVLPSLYSAVATYCWLIPMPSVRSSGPITIPVMVGALTVNVNEPLINPDVAEIDVVPAATPVTDPEVLTVATAGTEEFQVTTEERSALLPSS